MDSWRENASTEAQQDLDGLFNATIPFAQQNLDRHREFYPFAAAINTLGEMTFLSTQLTNDEHPDPVALINAPS